VFDVDNGNFLRSFVTGNDTGLDRPTGFDFMPDFGQDCNGNHHPDGCDIASGASLDANGNGVPDECECVGDVDGNGVIDVQDLIAVILAWGPCPKPPEACPADTDGDGAVDVQDLIQIILAWGGCS
jgi:hypothetical protein